ncbi:hypothetical protein AMTR_s00074p00105650 [Amborella trichopoda]|uniref:Uncharacterized protein n=1 Tax=Amborella trichopoda TaxID=13333 RepID=W1NMY2_AMBTC|nr:hypothetical protein AMTR_s00074p00105650 [Amborella trichopoda]
MSDVSKDRGCQVLIGQGSEDNTTKTAWTLQMSQAPFGVASNYDWSIKTKSESREDDTYTNRTL